MTAPKKLKVIANEEDFQRQHEDDAGFDLRTPIDVNLPSGNPVTITLPVRVAIPKNCVGIVAVRSSIGKRGISLANDIGVIDSGYRGELKIMLLNNRPHAQTIFEGERIAQLIVVPIQPVKVEFVDELDKTERGTGGTGSTGKV